MPIQISSISIQNTSVKQAIEKIARETFKLENPAQGDNLFVATAPTVMDEGSAIFYVNGADYRIYFKIGGLIKYVALT